MTDGVTRVTIKESGKSPYAVAIDVSGHTLNGDLPVSSGGGGTGPAPYGFLAASLGECTSMTVRMYAEERNWPLEEVEVVVEFHKEIIDRRPVDIFEKRVILHGADLSGEQRQKLLEISAKAPIQRTLESAPVIRTIL